MKNTFESSLAFTEKTAEQLHMNLMSRATGSARLLTKLTEINNKKSLPKRLLVSAEEQIAYEQLDKELTEMTKALITLEGSEQAPDSVTPSMFMQLLNSHNMMAASVFNLDILSNPHLTCFD